MKYLIRRETAADRRTVEELIKQSFWNVNFPGCDEHYFAHVLREHKDFVPELDLVIETDGRIIGSVMYRKTVLRSENGNSREILSFGPFCVHPDFQRKGYGKALLEHSFKTAADMGFDVIVIFGHPGNYISGGFKSCRKYNVCLEGDYFPAPLLVKELKEGALDGGRYFYEEGNAAAPCEDRAAFEEFDKTFPHMEKGYRTSQEEFYIYSHSAVVRD
ncbi:MAG: N-acetyltransferase [Ruminococcus sp.]|nr:N-acetyltransferase [Ruminococcus sp.]